MNQYIKAFKLMLNLLLLIKTKQKLRVNSLDSAVIGDIAAKRSRHVPFFLLIVIALSPLPNNHFHLAVAHARCFLPIAPASFIMFISSSISTVYFPQRWQKPLFLAILIFKITKKCDLEVQDPAHL